MLATGDSKMLENVDANSVTNEIEDAIAKALKQLKSIIKLNTQEQ